MEKFTKWSGEHEQEFAKRQESHKKARPRGNQPYVRREAPKRTEEAVAQDTTATTEAEPKTEE